MTKYQEPEVADPRSLNPGDQIGLSDAGPALQIIVGISDAAVEDAIWLSLANAPGQTGHIPEYGWTRPLPSGNVGVDLAGYGWIWGVYPTVLARRVIQ